ncbi:glycosyltransferase family 2 protein [Candidatus Pacearchaeota archaeon]|nr:glycosyltransferase family 2 protein [Candidatus Pacearchaeota archaeon]
MKIKNMWVVVPAYNEQKNISKIIEGIKKYCKNIIIVDDGSKDDTFKIAEKSNAIVLKHIVNLGKGAALKTGCNYALKQGAKIIIVLDADAQHNPNDIPKFVENIKKAPIVFGYRKLNKVMPFILKLGNWFINNIIGFLYNVKLRDSQCGYRAFTAEAYKKIRWQAIDYSMESEMIANAGKCKLKYKEVPIETIYSDKYKGTTVVNGIKIVLDMFFWKIFRR